ncbi:hypothetical protein HY948_03255 [Candidatus Gottesmanbacteria bacterium]|nr:hypothetical protein [Candidatus Gottesmanbacteria bacterium]
MRKIRLLPDVAVYVAQSYAAIFDYPLTESDVYRWVPFIEGPKELRVSPLKRRDIVKREERKQWSARKWEHAQVVAEWLHKVPTIQLVGVTGGLAMDNAKKSDDIDLFFVTSRGTTWITRFMATCIVELSGYRRKPGEKNVTDKICLNMFMAENALAICGKERDFFAAHEVLQMIPLRERDDAYKRFLLSNQWAKNFLPNAWREKIQYTKQRNIEKTHFIIFYLCFIFRFFEPIAKYLQLWYMRNRRTNEVISESVIRFHPVDARVWVKKALAKYLAVRNVPLDKIFYGS